MKPINTLQYIVFFLILGLASCADEVDDIFDASAAERMNAALGEYREILTASPNGWVMEYYAEKEPEKMGGFVYLCSFSSDGRVTMATELETAQAPKTQVISTYNLIADQGPVLTFDTYNELFHILSEPRGSSDIDGYSGDYEFVVLEADPEKVILKGKKYGNKITMTPLSAGQSWNDYLDAVIEMVEMNYYPKYNIIVNGSKTGEANEDYDLRLFNFGSFSQNAVYTPTGLKFYEPVTLGGQEVQVFVWDNGQKAFVSSEDGTNVMLIGILPENFRSYDDYIGTYSFDYINFEGQRRSLTVELTAQGRSSYKINGSSGSFTYIVNYNHTTGGIYVTSQDVQEITEGTVFIASLLKDNYLDGSTYYQYGGVMDINGRIAFRSNYPSSQHIGYIFLVDISGELWLYSYEYSYTDLIMTKKQ